MASDETIRAALRAAAAAHCSEEPAFRCRELCGECRRKAAAAVAAFLRALPERFVVSLGPGENYNNLPRNQMHIVAAALARAAEGEG
jgi:bacterioferritin-associated ferredoxin